MSVLIRPAKVGSAIVELLRQNRTGRTQRLLETLLLVDDGDGVEIGRLALCQLVRCDRKTIGPAIDDLCEEGLLSVTTPPFSPETGIGASTYHLRIAKGAQHEHEPQ